VNYSNAFDTTNPGPAGKPASGLDAFDTTEAAAAWTPVPPGLYVARIVSGGLTRTKKGDDAYRMAFEITEGEQRGRRISRTWTFTTKALTYAKRDLAAFGLTTMQQLLEPFPPAGREVYVRLVVALQRMDDGSESNDVKRIDVVRTADAPTKPFLIDPDAGAAERGAP
jgi:hypothetical protein